MDVLVSLQNIREGWINKVSHRLAKGEGTRLLFRAQLEQYFDLLIQAITFGDAAWLNPILDEWVNARTQTDLESPGNTLAPFLEQLILATYEVAIENLSSDVALQLFGALLPIFTYSYGYSANKEIAIHIAHVSQKLEEARLSLERLDHSKSDFISIAAHELKTPLTLIEGYASMLNERILEIDGANQNQILLKGIENGTERLKQIIDDMIDVSVIDNQMLTLKYQPVWINRLLEMVQYEFKDILAERKLSLEISPFPGSQEMTFGDEERLFQALRNVVSNAVKFTPDGGSIRVDGRILPGFVEIMIEDTGIGIDPEYHARVFDKFGGLGEASKHSSGKTKYKGGGAGLGLSITRGIVEAHGGTIWVESEGYDEVKCPGSKFHILIPVRKQPPDRRMATLFRTSLETGELIDPYG